MKPTSEILERIAKSSKEHKDGVFTRLYRYLLREDIYYAAYQKLYANRGATTKGIDDDTGSSRRTRCRHRRDFGRSRIAHRQSFLLCWSMGNERKNDVTG